MNRIQNAARGCAMFAVAFVLTLALGGPAVRPARANHLPADKIGVSASVMQVMVATASPVGPVSSGTVTLLQATLRNSSPTDLMIQVSAECGLWTDIVSPSSDAKASVKVWVELDGSPVPVTTDSNGDGVNDDPDDGKVVFANRDFQITGLLSADVLKLYLSTRNADEFNWITLNVGSGIHSLVVKGRLDVQVTGAGYAKAAIGKRTLIAEPAKLANDATVSYVEPAPIDLQPSDPIGLYWGAIQPGSPSDGAADLELFARSTGRAEVAVYDVTGRRVAQLYSGQLIPGGQRLRWDGRDASGHAAPAGFYLVQARMGAEKATTRLYRN